MINIIIEVCIKVQKKRNQSMKTIISNAWKTKDSQSSISNNYNEYYDYNYDECYGEYSSDKGSIRSTFKDWLEWKMKHGKEEKYKSYSD